MSPNPLQPAMLSGYLHGMVASPLWIKVHNHTMFTTVSHHKVKFMFSHGLLHRSQEHGWVPRPTTHDYPTQIGLGRAWSRRIDGWDVFPNAYRSSCRDEEGKKVDGRGRDTLSLDSITIAPFALVVLLCQCLCSPWPLYMSFFLLLVGAGRIGDM